VCNVILVGLQAARNKLTDSFIYIQYYSKLPCAQCWYFLRQYIAVSVPSARVGWTSVKTGLPAAIAAWKLAQRSDSTPC